MSKVYIEEISENAGDQKGRAIGHRDKMGRAKQK